MGFLGFPSSFWSVPMARSGEARPDGRTRELCVNGSPAYKPHQLVWQRVSWASPRPFGQFSKNPRVSATIRRSSALQVLSGLALMLVGGNRQTTPAGYLISRISFSLFFAA